MRRLPLLILSVAALLVSGWYATTSPVALAAKAGADKNDADKLEATWVATLEQVDGVDVPAGELKAAPRTLTIKGDTYQFRTGTNKVVTGMFKLDPTKKPPTLDLMPNDGPDKGKTIQAIYAWDGDTLKVCTDMSTKARPTDFTTKDKPGQHLFQFKRQK